MTKKWWKSKTLWVNFLAFAAIGIQMLTGEYLLDVDTQAAAIVVINFILRLITKSGLE